MIVQGMPWPLVFPLALGVLIWGVFRSIDYLKEQEIAAKKAKKKKKLKKIKKHE
jgi:hypothetical protein